MNEVSDRQAAEEASAAHLERVTEGGLERPDGRHVAWSDWGPLDGIPVLRLPGTPGCRFTIRADKEPWETRHLRMVTTERPGFGASTGLPGRGFVEPADDLEAVLDSVGWDRVFVIGGSGSAPHQLAFAARHPDRVRAMTIVVGAAPTTVEEEQEMITLNRVASELIRAGDFDQLRELQTKLREALLADPLGAFWDLMDHAPEADRVVMSAPTWRQSQAVSVREALRQGIDGWFDEAVALKTRWDEVDLAAVACSLTWWHAPRDANAPLSAAKRVLANIEHARLELFGEDDGHLAGHHREGEILDELLARG